MVDRGRLDFRKYLNFVDPRINRCDVREPLGDDFTPGNWEVICMGGKESFDHIGNRRFRVCIANNLKSYMNAKSKHRKSQVVTIIVDAVKDSSTQARGGFVRKDTVTGKWFEVEDKIAREKVGHALRDAIKLEERRAKKRERKEKISSEGTMAETSKPPMAKRRRIENSRESSSLALAIVGEEFGDMLPTSGTTKEDWEKSLKESASKFSLSDCEETDDAVSNKGGIITTLQSSIIENNNTQNPLYPMETNLSPIPIITIPEKATSWKPIVLGDTIAQKNSIPSLDIPCDSNQFQHMPMANWNPPGDSITEEAYKAYLQSKANSSGDLISSSHFDLLEYPIKPSSSSLQKGQPPTRREI